MPLTIRDDRRVLDYYPLRTKGVCKGPNSTYSLTWDVNDACWGGNPFCWDDVSFIIENFGKVIGTEDSAKGWLETYEKLDDEKKKRFIYLVAKVKGEPDLYKGKKEVKDIKLSAKDIKLTCETITKTVEIVEVK